MPKQLFQRPAHVNRNQARVGGFGPEQADWGRKKNRPPKKQKPKSQTPTKPADENEK